MTAGMNWCGLARSSSSMPGFSSTLQPSLQARQLWWKFSHRMTRSCAGRSGAGSHEGGCAI
eukprot:scaffold72570_cov44-Phaeocystis_antarctica.AAC.3